jgi:hypothetical protein
MQHFYRSMLEAEWARFVLGIGDDAAADGNARGEEIG